MLLEPVRGEIELVTARPNLQVFALDNAGARAKMVVATRTPRGLKFDFGGEAATWYRLQSR